MEVTIVPISKILKKGVWHYQPYSKAVRDAEAVLEQSPFPVLLLGEVVESAKRGFFRSNTTNQSEGIPLIRHVNINSGDLDLSNVVYISSADHEKLHTTQVQTGDVLIGIIAMPDSINSVVYDLEQPANISQHICRLRLTDGMNPYYLVYFLKSDIGQYLLQSRLTGAVSRTISIQSLLQLPIICPPLQHQEKIASQVKAKKAQAAQHRQRAEALQNEANQAFDQLLMEGAP